MKRTGLSRVLAVAIVLVLTALALNPSSVKAQSGANASIIIGCDGGSVSFSGLPTSSFIEADFFLADVSTGSFVRVLANNFHGANPGSSAQLTSHWPSVPVGSGVVVFAFANGTEIGFDAQICAGPSNSTGAPPNSVLASFPSGSALYSLPSTAKGSLIPGVSITAGQTWFVFGISADKKFYQVYIANGTTAWVPVGNARLQAPLPGSSVASDEDDNGTAAGATTVVVASSSGGGSSTGGTFSYHGAPPTPRGP